ncbi:hypothetical protein GCM10007928_02420 [Sulfitobacter porphyrae]|nr:hypothetical protein GCM10007928_02420 [Sulfitobacter porphyrae]
MVNFDLALSALRSGDRIMVTLKDPTKESDRTRYNLLGGGALSAATFRKLSDQLEPVGDGLFPEDAPSQTYRLVVE